RIVQELQNQGLWSSTLVTLTAKHGQNPRLGAATLLSDATFTDALSAAGVGVAQSTADDVNLLWLQDQSQTDQAVSAIQGLERTNLTVYFKGTAETVPGSQVIDQVLSGEALKDYHLGDPLKNARTPDIVVTLQPGYVMVGNPLHFTFKRAEHGGFSEDDTHVALVVSSGGLDPSVQGTTESDEVATRQIAVTALKALGLDPKDLQGAKKDHTHQLPGLSLETAPGGSAQQDAVLQNINHFVIIYQENWSFDSLYGEFPGANGLQIAAGTIPQVDKNGNPISTLPQPLDNNGNPDPRFPPANGQPALPVAPYDITQYIQPSDTTGDIVHRFHHEQLQIDNGVLEPSNGNQDKFVTW